MAYEINIIGEVIPYDWGDDPDYICSAHVERQLANAKGEDITVNINSIGGDVAEGFIIYTALRKYAENNKATVTTYAKGRCYSIATIIFLAGDARIANKYINPFIHNAWTYTAGDSRQLFRDAADLENTNKVIAEFYAEHTELTYEEARAWMDADTYIEPEECVKIRFATAVEEILRPVALMKTFNKKSNNMAVNNKKEKLFDKIAGFFNSLEAKNVEVFTSTNESVIFPDLEDGAEPKVGDKAEVDGKAAEGEILMADGRTFVFVAGILEEIKEKEEEEAGDQTEEIAKLKAENAELKEKLEAQNSKLSTIETKMNGFEKTFNKLGSLVSTYNAEENPDNKRKSAEEEETTKEGLSSSIKALKKAREEK